ncbi:MAG: hypothetical protein ACREK2_05260 [Gemmatimonadota bacterium]
MLSIGSAEVALGQQCLGRPLEPGEQAIAARIDLERLVTVSGEYSGAAEVLAWHALAGVAADELIPPGEFAPAFGGGLTWTGLHRALCPAASFLTSERPPADDQRTIVHIGVGVGRRLGEERIRGTAFLFPHLRLVEDFESRTEGWLEGGFSLRGERFWGMAVLGLQVGGYSPGEDVMDGSARFASGVAF